MATVSTSGVTASVLQAGGLVTGDDVSVSATGTFRNANNTADDKSAGAGKTVALSSRLGGADAGNYTITGQTRTTASISPRAVTVSGITAANKIYDGTTAATVNTASVTFNNLVAGDDLSVAATGVFADMNAGTDKMVSLTSSYSGADRNNYTITDQTSTTASIVYRLAMTEPTQILNPVNLTVRASLLPAFSSSATVRTDLLSQLNEGELHKASALSNITTRTLPAESTYSNTPDTPNPAKGSDASQNSGSTISTSPTPIAGTGAASRNMDAPNRQESSAAPHNATPAGRPSPLEPGGPGASETAPLQIFTVFAPTAGGTDRPFDIPLPSAVMELLQSEGNVRASLRGMRGLPAWLSFDKEKWVLKAKRVPDNAFPLEVILTAGSKRVMLLVQRSTSRS